MFHMAPTPGRCIANSLPPFEPLPTPKTKNPSSYCYRSKSYRKRRTKRCIPSQAIHPPSSTAGGGGGHHPFPSHQVKSSRQNGISKKLRTKWHQSH